MTAVSVISLAVPAVVFAVSATLMLTGRYRPFGPFGSTAELFLGVISIMAVIGNANRYETGQMIGDIWLGCLLVTLGLIGLSAVLRSGRRSQLKRR